MRVRNRPSARCGSSSARRLSVSWSPPGASHTTPTRWPRRACSVARSRTCRNRPPTGARRQWRMREERAPREPARRSEPALVDVDRVAGENGVVRWYIHLLYDSAHVAAGDLDAALAGAVAVAAGDGDRLLHRHAADVGVLAGAAHLAQDEERSVLCHIDRDLGVLDVLRAEACRYGTRKSSRGSPACRNVADQRHGNHALLVHRV